jgi:hypothetical protein
MALDSEASAIQSNAPYRDMIEENGKVLIYEGPEFLRITGLARMSSRARN